MATYPGDEMTGGAAWPRGAGPPARRPPADGGREAPAPDLAAIEAEARALARDLRALAREVRAVCAATPAGRAGWPAPPPTPAVRWRVPPARGVPAPPVPAPAGLPLATLTRGLPLPAAVVLYVGVVAWLDRRAYRPLTLGDAAVDLVLLALALAGVALLEWWRRRATGRRD
ncbi:MAG TPA: hypothetical protein VFW96_28070 [Thermomicrobiales bacterium]|nr:hypothetical protein [Thermomicrobiales bacterium]